MKTNKETTKKEIIICSAIRMQDGYIVRGHRHHHCLMSARIEEIVEEFASIEHKRWSKWQKYLHSQCFKSPEFTGALIIPADLVARWERQIATPYAKLSEKEKQSDRDQVYPYIQALTQAYQAGIDDAVKRADMEIYALENTLEKSKELPVAIGHKRVYEHLKLISEYKGKLEAWKEIREMLDDTIKAFK